MSLACSLLRTCPFGHAASPSWPFSSCAPLSSSCIGRLRCVHILSLSLPLSLSLSFSRSLSLSFSLSSSLSLPLSLSVKCDATDGPALLFALISLYKPAKATHQDKLTSDFNNAWTHFTKGDPKNKINHLGPKLNEAIDLKIQLNWSTTCKK